jgi:hypothetical protein
MNNNRSCVLLWETPNQVVDESITVFNLKVSTLTIQQFQSTIAKYVNLFCSFVRAFLWN